MKSAYLYVLSVIATLLVLAFGTVGVLSAVGVDISSYQYLLPILKTATMLVFCGFIVNNLAGKPLALLWFILLVAGLVSYCVCLFV